MEPDFFVDITFHCFPEIMHLSITMVIVKPFEVSSGTDISVRFSPSTCDTPVKVTYPWPVWHDIFPTASVGTVTPFTIVI